MRCAMYYSIDDNEQWLERVQLMIIEHEQRDPEPERYSFNYSIHSRLDEDDYIQDQY